MLSGPVSVFWRRRDVSAHVLFLETTIVVEIGGCRPQIQPALFVLLSCPSQEPRGQDVHGGGRGGSCWPRAMCSFSPPCGYLLTEAGAEPQGGYKTSLPRVPLFVSDRGRISAGLNRPQGCTEEYWLVSRSWLGLGEPQSGHSWCQPPRNLAIARPGCDVMGPGPRV